MTMKMRVVEEFEFICMYVTYLVHYIYTTFPNLVFFSRDLQPSQKQKNQSKYIHVHVHLITFDKYKNSQINVFKLNNKRCIKEVI